MSEGVAVATSYVVEYKFLIPETNRYFPTVNSIEEEKDFFYVIIKNTTENSRKLYKNIVEALEYAEKNDIQLKQPIKCETGYANIVLGFKNRLALDMFEREFIHILIH